MPLEGQLAVDDARQVQQVVDQARFELYVALDRADVLEQVGRQARVAQQGGRGVNDRLERGAQLVAEDGEEAVLRLVRLLELARLGAGELFALEQLGAAPLGERAAFELRGEVPQRLGGQALFDVVMERGD